jgi:uncharacterized membrane protein YhaH (DUF805 family)
VFAADTSRLAMSLYAFWWLASLVLITLSVVLLRATWTGREVAFRVGGKTATQYRERHNPKRQPGQQSNIVVGCLGFLTGLIMVFILVSQTTLTMRMLSA